LNLNRMSLCILGLYDRDFLALSIRLFAVVVKWVAIIGVAAFNLHLRLSSECYPLLQPWYTHCDMLNVGAFSSNEC
jgi:hypothetical protein